MEKSTFYVISAEWLDGQTNKWERSFVISRGVSTAYLQAATHHDNIKKAMRMLQTLVKEGNGRNHLVEKVDVTYTKTPVQTQLHNEK